MNIEERQQQVISEFSMFDDWMQKYEYIIDLANELAPFDPAHRTDDNLIRGCQSRVWLHAQLSPEGRVLFTADSDAIITRGMVALVIRLLSDASPSEILEADLHCMRDIGLYEHLSPTRSNGLASMIKQMKAQALAYMTSSPK
ncbi:MAG: SufE family protein [Flavobacteriales bacterium]|nr:SufE family protein [Flavobacteriales bacterium]